MGDACKGRFPRVEKIGETTDVSEQNGGIRRSGDRGGTRKRRACFNGGMDGRKDRKNYSGYGKSRVMKGEVKIMLLLTASCSVHVDFELHARPTIRF
jgi:hypothetical protein